MSFQLHNRLPDKFPEGSRVFVVDPMLATGMGLLCMKIKVLPNVGLLNYSIVMICAIIFSVITSLKTDYDILCPIFITISILVYMGLLF